MQVKPVLWTIKLRHGGIGLLIKTTICLELQMVLILLPEKAIY